MLSQTFRYTLVQILAVVVLVMNVTSNTATAADLATTSSKFDHLATGFPLTGKHVQLKCEVCHVDGDLEGLPTDCASCHDNIIAIGQPLNHIVTSSNCDTCHTAEGWEQVNRIDHTEVSANCVECHNGTIAAGKPQRHLATSDICSACHSNVSFKPVLLVNHQETLGTCSSCHNNVIATGQSRRHVFTNRECDICHETTAWTPASVNPGGRRGIYDHAGITSACARCHNGSVAQGKPLEHIETTELCESCHTIGGWFPVVNIDHEEVIGSCGSAGCHNKPLNHINATDSCQACHTAQTWVPLLGVDHGEVLGSCDSAGCHALPLTGHINVIGECDGCHRSTQWVPVLRVNHSFVIGTCFSCHDGVITITKPANHVDTSNECDLCHATISFNPVLVVDHTQVNGVCSSCHNLPAVHVSTTDECDACHNDLNWSFAAVDHSGFSNNCISCHNGVEASGKGAQHLSTTDVCDACHDVFPGTWSPVAPNRVDHGETIGTCASCHAKPVNHLATSNNCEACHAASPVPWTPVAAFNVDHNEVLGVCSSCHDNVIAQGKGANHIPTTEECNSCHSTALWTPAATDHSAIVTNCINCHDNVTTSGKTPGLHMPTSDLCELCHDKFPATWTPVLSLRVDHSQVMGTCISCHDDVTAPGKGTGHMSTTNECQSCHAEGPVPWTPVATASVDHTQVIGSCVSCHDNVTASGKGAGHMLTTNECQSCHTEGPIPWTPVATASVDHNQVIGTCIGCHDEVTAQGKGAGHILSTDECQLCHDQGPLPWTPVPANNVDHTQTIGTCDSCHSADLPVDHCPISTDCIDCHTDAGWLPATNTDCLGGPAIEPVADPGGPYAGSFGGTGGAITVTGAVVVGTNPNNYPVQYTWNFGDGNAPVTVDVPTTSYTYNFTGTYTVTLTVTLITPGGNVASLPASTTATISMM